MPPVFCSRTAMRVLSASRGSGAAMRITFGTTLIVYAITCVWSLPAPAAPPLRQLQTRDLQLVWFHPAEDYLAPYAARAFENSMQWQKRTWGWTPDGKVNVLLKDFGDYGNAGARSTPNNALIVDIAPFSYSFETFVASERIFSLMNHELVHVANMDQATRTDLRWRHALGGKIQVDAQHPETLLYRYLAVPRTVVPRWYLEGIAVFFETWMSGGRGRAQGAYDEMVFRAMVRDHARFYDLEGLAAEGTKVDFQVGVNNYLYGTRFVSYLGLKYSPQKVVEWAARHDRPLSGDPPATLVARRTGVDLARVLRPRPRCDDCWFPLSRRGGLHRHHVAQGRPHQAPGRRQGADVVQGHLAGLGPGQQDGVLHDRQQQRLPRRDGTGHGQRSDAHAVEGRPHRRPGVRPQRPLAHGGQRGSVAVSAAPRGAGRGRCETVCQLQLRYRRARGVRVRAGWALAVRQLLLHRRVEHLSLHHRQRQDRGIVQRANRPVPPAAAA